LLHQFRLSPRGGGVSYDDAGAFVGVIPMLARTRRGGKDEWRPHDCDELSREMSARWLRKYKVHVTMLPNYLLRVAGLCVLLTLLLLPQAVRAGGLTETFNAICTDTFPSFGAMEGKVKALGGWLEPLSDAIFSRVPFVVANSAKTGSTDGHRTMTLDNMIVDYAEGVVADLPAAGCSIGRRSAIDEATVAQLLNSFETTVFLGYNKGSLLEGGPYRAWVVRLNGRRAVLRITELQFGGRAVGVLVALVRLDETLIDRLTAPNNVPQVRLTRLN
jgi:hypothetical protein